MASDAKKILLVEDEKAIRDAVAAYLEREGYWVVGVGDGQSAIEEFEKHQFDLVVLDLMLPKIPGERVCRTIRDTSDVPIIMLTAKGEIEDRIIGLELGADDYVPKPCPPRELAARLNAILRRTANMPSAIAPVVAGPLTINPSRREATANGIVIDLTGTELTLLEVLARKVGTPVPKDEIYQKVLGRAMQRYDRAIDVHVSSIRHKLAAVLGTSVAIESIRGVGYQFVVR